MEWLHNCLKIKHFEIFENLLLTVTPAKAGVQKVLKRLDTGFRRYDDLPNLKGNSKLSFCFKSIERQPIPAVKITSEALYTLMI